MLYIDRDKKRVADAVLEKEKNRPVGQVFDARFSWSDMLDAVADVYLGVSLSYGLHWHDAYITCSLRFGASSRLLALQCGTFRCGTWVSLGTKWRSCRQFRLSC
jgi:hypothetical protein